MMENFQYKKFVIREDSAGVFTNKIEFDDINSLPPGEVLIKVCYSSLNYKDALSSRGHKGITRKYPHTPGIDAAGIVAYSLHPDFKSGDEVIVIGFDLGMNTDGGFGEYIRVPAKWIIPLPNGLTLKESMIFGTAGMTAALCLFEFQRRELMPGIGPVLITGATGGVGSIATSILSKAGYEVTVSTGKPDKSEFLRMLGAKYILSREDVKDIPEKQLLPRKWKAVIDNIGGSTLNYCIKSTDYWGSVAVVGLVGSDMFNTSVYPFILRGVSLVGIDSAERPYELKKVLWNKLANEWKPENINFISREIRLEDLSVEIENTISGNQVGRIILRHD